MMMLSSTPQSSLNPVLFRHHQHCCAVLVTMAVLVMAVGPVVFEEALAGGGPVEEMPATEAAEEELLSTTISGNVFYLFGHKNNYVVDEKQQRVFINGIPAAKSITLGQYGEGQPLRFYVEARCDHPPALIFNKGGQSHPIYIPRTPEMTAGKFAVLGQEFSYVRVGNEIYVDGYLKSFTLSGSPLSIDIRAQHCDAHGVTLCEATGVPYPVYFP